MLEKKKERLQNEIRAVREWKLLKLGLISGLPSVVFISLMLVGPSKCLKQII